jgi:hypothetical protein
MQNKLPPGYQDAPMQKAPDLTAEERAHLKRGGRIAYRRDGARIIKTLVPPGTPRPTAAAERARPRRPEPLKQRSELRAIYQQHLDRQESERLRRITAGVDAILNRRSS